MSNTVLLIGAVSTLTFSITTIITSVAAVQIDGQLAAIKLLLESADIGIPEYKILMAQLHEAIDDRIGMEQFSFMNISLILASSMMLISYLRQKENQDAEHPVTTINHIKIGLIGAAACLSLNLVAEVVFNAFLIEQVKGSLIADINFLNSDVVKLSETVALISIFVIGLAACTIAFNASAKEAIDNANNNILTGVDAILNGNVNGRGNI